MPAAIHDAVLLVPVSEHLNYGIQLRITDVDDECRVPWLLVFRQGIFDYSFYMSQPLDQVLCAASLGQEMGNWDSVKELVNDHEVKQLAAVNVDVVGGVQEEKIGVL